MKSVTSPIQLDLPHSKNFHTTPSDSQVKINYIQESHCTLSLFVFIHFILRVFFWIANSSYATTLILKRGQEEIELLFTSFGIFLAITNIFACKTETLLSKYSISIINLAFLAGFVMVFWTEASRLVYDVCIDFPHSMRGQCDNDKWLLCILLGYSFLGIYLVGAMLVCSLKVVYYSTPTQEYDELPSIVSENQEIAKDNHDPALQA